MGIHSFGQPTKCTVEEMNGIFLLTVIGDDPHLLDLTLISSLQEALNHVENRARDTQGCVLITTAEGDHFSYGFDQWYAQEACSNDDYRGRYNKMIDSFRDVLKKLISLQMPTIAAVNGFACDAGLMLALSHDYLKIRRDEQSLQLTGLDTKMTLPDYFTALIRAKVTPGARGQFALGGLQFKAEDAKDMGIELKQYEKTELVGAAKKEAERLARRRWNGKVYAETRKSLYPELCDALNLIFTPVLPSKL